MNIHFLTITLFMTCVYLPEEGNWTLETKEVIRNDCADETIFEKTIEISEVQEQEFIWTGFPYPEEQGSSCELVENEFGCMGLVG